MTEKIHSTNVTLGKIFRRVNTIKCACGNSANLTARKGTVFLCHTCVAEFFSDTNDEDTSLNLEEEC